MSKRDRNCNDGLPQRVARRAARRAPPQLAERLEEEWLADLLSRKGRLARFRFALGCWWAALLIAREHCAVRAAASTATADQNATLALARYDWPFLSRQSIVLVSILALHVVLIYCLANGLGRRIVTALTPTIQVAFFDAPRKVSLPPPLSPPTLIHPSLNIPTPVLNLSVRSEPSLIDSAAATPPQVTNVAPSRPALPVNRVVGAPGGGFPDTDDYYPEASRRLGESGSSVVRVCVDPHGRLANLPTIAESSGSARLDAGAIRLANAGSGRYRPTTEDGRPVSSCYAFRIRFTLKE